MLTLDAAQWICQRAVSWPWLWVSGSQLFLPDARPPEVTENESYVIAFAWDATQWPAPAADITAALEQWCEEVLPV